MSKEHGSVCLTTGRHVAVVGEPLTERRGARTGDLHLPRPARSAGSSGQTWGKQVRPRALGLLSGSPRFICFWISLHSCCVRRPSYQVVISLSKARLEWLSGTSPIAIPVTHFPSAPFMPLSFGFVSKAEGKETVVCYPFAPAVGSPAPYSLSQPQGVSLAAFSFEFLSQDK